MEFQRLFLTPLFLFYFVFSGGLIVSAMEMHGPKYTKLFVFGDSYSATGNNQKPETISWKEPYGITYPGKPSGRFSNGRVLTDFVAKHIGVKSPLPYTFRKANKNKQFKDGVNFAYGGAGVMDTFAKVPNMTTQINFFRRLIKHDVFTAEDLSSSIALVTLAGNDYTTFRATMPYSKDWKAFIAKVVDQLVVDLKRIADLGVKKILVTNLEPIGCLPQTTAMISYKMCYNSSNSIVELHNLALSQAVSKLYYEYKNSSSFIVLDLNTAFTFVLQNVKPHNESTKFENPLKPCCVGVGHGNMCGSVDKNGAKKYTVCENPDSAFFWDNDHPTEKGWESIYQSLEATFTQLNY